MNETAIINLIDVESFPVYQVISYYDIFLFSQFLKNLFGFKGLHCAPLQWYKANCAPLTCVVHHQPALCTIMQKRDFREVMITPNIFLFWWLIWTICRKQTLFVCIWWVTKTDNIHLAQHVVPPTWCTVHIIITPTTVY